MGPHFVGPITPFGLQKIKIICGLDRAEGNPKLEKIKTKSRSNQKYSRSGTERNIGQK
jgi:hypothetical protein